MPLFVEQQLQQQLQPRRGLNSLKFLFVRQTELKPKYQEP